MSHDETRSDGQQPRNGGDKGELGQRAWTGAELVAALLAAAGIKHTFGISGQRILPLWHALDEVNIGITLARHEQGAAYMADTHARITGDIGVAMSTSGPGAINLLGGAAAAWMDSVPMLLITAQAETGEFGRYGIQEGTGRGRTPNIPLMFQATTKQTYQPKKVHELRRCFESAIRLAQAGRPGPVHIDIPSDLFTAEVPSMVGDLPEFSLRAVSAGPEPKSDEVAAVVKRLAQAERPLILAGGGIGSPATAAQLIELAERLDVPIAGTFAAKRYLDERHPLVLGPIGIYGRAAANHALHAEADVVLALGVAFSWLSTSGWSIPMPPDRLIRVDIDRRELTNNYMASLGLNAEAGAFVRGLAEAMVGASKVGNGLSRAERLRREHPDSELEAGALLHPVEVCEAINAHLDGRTSVVADIGQNAYWVERYLRTRGDDRFVLNAGLGAMGHAVAGALGAWLARREMPHERVIATTGDGGFLMSGLEVSAAVAEQAAVTWVIFNNGTLGTQRAWFEREGHRPVAVDLPPTDFVGLARSLGADGRRVTTRAELDQALEWALAAARPIVIDAIIDPAPAPSPFFGIEGAAR